jgi:23S rRNA A2030 N6-methylase RlmJ
MWLDVPRAAQLVEQFNLEFVDYEEVEFTLENLNALRDKDSTQAIRNGMGPGKKREGIVIRPPFEVRLNNGERLIAKHKRDDFRETKSPRIVGEKLKILKEAEAVADEWVTAMRLEHILQKLPEATGMEHTGMVVKAMVEDVLIEGEGEFEATKDVKKAIGKEAAALWRKKVVAIGLGDE